MTADTARVAARLDAIEAAHAAATPGEWHVMRSADERRGYAQLRHCGLSGWHFHWRHRRHRSAFDGSLTEREIAEFDAACAAQWPRPGRNA